MPQNMAAMKIALRVLTATTEHQAPDLADVEALRRFAPEHVNEPIDELACDVIQKALKQRAKARGGSSV